MAPKRASGAAQKGSGARPRTAPEGGTSGGAAAPEPAAQKRKAAAAHKLTPVPLQEVKKHADYLALLTEKSISHFRGEVSKDVFFDDDAYDAMPDRLTFQFERWINKDLGNVDCHWDFDNTRGEVSWGLLIAGGFKYIGSKVPRRDGLAAARAAAAAPPRPPRIVKVEYEESGEKKQQEWEYMEPEDVTVCQRERQGHANFAPKLNIDLDMVTTPFDMWFNASFPPEQLLADERFANLRLAGTDSHKRKTTAGEMLLVRMLMLLAAVHYPNVPVKKLFQEHRGRQGSRRSPCSPGAQSRWGVGGERAARPAYR